MTGKTKHAKLPHPPPALPPHISLGDFTPHPGKTKQLRYYGKQKTDGSKIYVPITLFPKLIQHRPTDKLVKIYY